MLPRFIFGVVAAAFRKTLPQLLINGDIGLPPPPQVIHPNVSSPIRHFTQKEKVIVKMNAGEFYGLVAFFL